MRSSAWMLSAIACMALAGCESGHEKHERQAAENAAAACAPHGVDRMERDGNYGHLKVTCRSAPSSVVGGMGMPGREGSGFVWNREEGTHAHP